MIFQVKNTRYHGCSAVDIVRQLESDIPDYPYPRRSLREFLLWSLDHFRDRVHPREMDLSDRLEDETLALGFLYLLDESEAGKMISPG